MQAVVQILHNTNRSHIIYMAVSWGLFVLRLFHYLNSGQNTIMINQDLGYLEPLLSGLKASVCPLLGVQITTDWAKDFIFCDSISLSVNGDKNNDVCLTGLRRELKIRNLE